MKMKIKLNDGIIRFLYKFIDVESSGEASVPNERMYEYSFALARILESGNSTRRILDVGSVARINPIPATLCELGYKVFGIDGRKFAFTHKNFQFSNQDIRETNFPSDYFDVVNLISTIEHIGLGGRYNISKTDEEGDKKAIKEISRILKLNGKLILTTELGNPQKSTNMAKLYTYDDLMKLLEQYRLEKVKFYSKNGNIWEEKNKVSDNGLFCLEALLVKK